MHFALLAFIAVAAFWSTLPVKLIAVAGTVYGLVQLVKKYFPKISGPYAVLVNVLFSVTGVLMVAQPGDLKTPAFWSSLVMTALAAAGVHGTVRSALTPPATDPAPPAPVAQA